MPRLILGTSLALLLAGFASHLHAQAFTTSPCPTNQQDGSWSFGSSRVCELRTATLPLINGHLALSGRNGSIDVIGEDRSDIQLEAQVTAQASSREEAEALERKIEIVTGGGEIRDEGPKAFGLFHQNWSVSYRMRVPRHLAAHLHTENGSVKLAELDGAITAETTNGSMTLRDLAGDVTARTTNGSLKVSLSGSQWKGNGLFAKTTNGGVSVTAPADYSAHLVAGTTNGGVHVGFPASTQARSRHIDASIGNGGPTLRFETTHGGIHIDRN
jgi:DUF4097 and DUF4098 domain-containing protein YvlB